MTYEYACEACGHQWEAEQSIKDQPLKVCSSCGAEKAKRLVSGGTGFLLKGGGWYADGYGSKAPSAAGSSDSASTGKSSSSSKPEAASGTSETKSDTKAPSTDKAPKAATTSAAAS